MIKGLFERHLRELGNPHTLISSAFFKKFLNPRGMMISSVSQKVLTVSPSQTPKPKG